MFPSLQSYFTYFENPTLFTVTPYGAPSGPLCSFFGNKPKTGGGYFVRVFGSGFERFIYPGYIFCKFGNMVVPGTCENPNYIEYVLFQKKGTPPWLLRPPLLVSDIFFFLWRIVLFSCYTPAHPPKPVMVEISLNKQQFTVNSNMNFRFYMMPQIYTLFPRGGRWVVFGCRVWSVEHGLLSRRFTREYDGRNKNQTTTEVILQGQYHFIDLLNW